MGRAVLVFCILLNACGSVYVYYFRPDVTWYLYGSIPTILFTVFLLGFYRA